MGNAYSFTITQTDQHSLVHPPAAGSLEMLSHNGAGGPGGHGAGGGQESSPVSGAEDFWSF